MNYLNNNTDTNTNTHKYLNASYSNNTSTLRKAVIKETRTSAILKNPSLYKMAVVRFDVDSSSIPINIPNMKKGSKTETLSYVTLKYLGNYYTENVIYINKDTSYNKIIDVPYIYNYQTWLDFVNTAFLNAFVSSGAVGDPPQYIYDKTSNLIDLYVDHNFLPSAGVNKIEIFINPDMEKYLYNFQFDLNTELNGTNNLYELKHVISNTNTLLMPPIGSRLNMPISVQTVPQLYKNSQSFGGMTHWNSLRSLVLSSSSLPYLPELISATDNNSSDYNSDNQFLIISDFLNDFTINDRYILQYLPTAEYRYINLISNTPINSLDIQLYWTDFNGTFYPFYIPPSSIFSVKILFEKI